jgi:hypothetical protein
MKRFLFCAALGLAAMAAAGGSLLAGHGRGRWFARHHGGWAAPAYRGPVAAALPNAYPPIVVADDTGTDDPEPYQNQRYLRVKNDTGQKLTVWVRYRAPGEDGNWAWLPGDSDAVEYELGPGEETYLALDDQRLSASRVRIWAETADGRQMDEYREQDLWLVPEKDDNDEHWYYGAEMEDFTFTFAAAD